MKDSIFNRTFMQKEKLNQLYKLNRSFRNVFSKDMTKEFFEDLNNRVFGTKPDHFIIFLYGSTGSLKSSIAQEIAKKVDKDLTVDQIVFSNRAVIDIMPKVNRKQVIIRDESPRDFGVGSTRVQADVSMYSETLRKAGISLIFIRPIFQEISQAHYYLRTIEVSDDLSVVRVAVQDVETRNYLGYILIEIDYGNELWEQYEKKKDAFLEDVMQGNRSSLDVEGAAKKVIASDDFSWGMNQKMIRLLVHKMFSGYATTELSLIESEIQLQKNKIKHDKIQSL